MIEAIVYRLPKTDGYPLAALRVDPADDAVAVRFLTAIAKEFWP